VTGLKHFVRDFKVMNTLGLMLAKQTHTIIPWSVCNLDFCMGCILQYLQILAIWLLPGWYFHDTFSHHWCDVHHENTQRWMVYWYKGL